MKEMRKVTVIKTNFRNYYDLLKTQPYLKRLGAYNPLPERGEDYDVLGFENTYGVYRYMPVSTRVPTACSIYTKWNPTRGRYDILFLSR